MVHSKIIDVQRADIQMCSYMKLGNNAHHKILPAKSTVVVTL